MVLEPQALETKTADSLEHVESPGMSGLFHVHVIVVQLALAYWSRREPFAGLLTRVPVAAFIQRSEGHQADDRAGHHAIRGRRGNPAAEGGGSGVA